MRLDGDKLQDAEYADISDDEDEANKPQKEQIEEKNK